MKVLLNRDDLYNSRFEKIEYEKTDSVKSKTIELVGELLFKELLDASQEPKE